MKIIDKEVLSSDKTHQLKGKLYIPEGSAKGMLHVVHGMIEHIGRYDSFMREMAQEGYIVFGYDHLGHGHTALDDAELGFIAHKDGWQRLVDDVFIFGNTIKKAVGKDIPFILMGHSMGSFIVRLCATKYNHYDKLIVMGTGGPNPASDVGIALTGILKRLRGDLYQSRLIDNMAFGAYNKRFADENDPIAWLSKDIENRENNRRDKLCSFEFSISAMQDLIRLNKECNTKKWFGSVDKTKPVLLTSGTDDPVGDYGKGVEKIYEMLTRAGVDTTIRLYEGYRHEILNDTCRNEVIRDIKEFIKA